MRPGLRRRRRCPHEEQFNMSLLTADERGPVSATHPDGVATSLLRRGRAWWHAMGVWLALALLVGVASLLSEHFLTAHNLFNVLRQASMIAIIGAGMTVVIISGGIDLAVGSIVLLC